jgi:large subunit ribosomal protein L17
LALFRNLTRALFEHDRITTTLAKAKEVRPFVERLITIAKRGIESGDTSKALHARRLALQWLHDKDAIAKLFKEVAPRYKDRAGGYTRIVKLHTRRLGDAGFTAIIELLKEGETKVRAKEREAPPAPAPAPVSTPAPAPAAAKSESTPETPST